MPTPTTPTPLTAPAVFPQASDERPANALTVIKTLFLSSLFALWKFFTPVYCELLQIMLLASLALVVGNHLWHSALLAVIVIMSAIGYVYINSVVTTSFMSHLQHSILLTGYRKLHNDTKATRTCTCTCHGCEYFCAVIWLSMTLLLDVLLGSNLRGIAS